MTVHASQVEIEELILPEIEPGDTLREAFARYEANNPQFGLDWLQNLASHALGTHEQAVLYVARRAADDFVILPLKRNARNGHTASLGNFYTSAYSPVVCTDSPTLLFTALFQHLASKAGATSLTLSPLTSDPLLFDQIQAALIHAGWTGVHRFFCFGNWMLESRFSTYESFLTTRPSQLRNTIARRTRQFLEGGRGTLGIIRGGDALEESITQFTTIYAKSWKREEPFPEFIPALLRLSASRGWLRLGIATYDEVAIASQIWLICGDKAYIFKLAHREDYKQLSPGTVLTAYMVEHALDDDSVSSIDFLSGDDSFKEHWMTERKECFGIAAYNPFSSRGRALQAWHAFKCVVKKFLPRRPSA